MSENKTAKNDRLEQFERRFVFRTARGYFLALAVLAVVTFVGGVFAGARGLITIEPDAPAEPILPAGPKAPPALTLDDVRAWIKHQEESPTSVASTKEAEWVAQAKQADDPKVDPARARFAELFNALKALFPEPTYSWKDTYIRECSRTSPYGCLRYERRLDKQGVSEIVDDAFRPLGDASIDEINDVMTAVIAVLEQTPLPQRSDLIAPTVEAYRESQQDYRSEMRDHEYEITTLRLEYEEKLQAYEDELAELEKEKSMFMMTGLYAVLAGLGLLVLVSVFLAHFAIERHLRLVREALAGRQS